VGSEEIQFLVEASAKQFQSSREMRIKRTIFPLVIIILITCFFDQFPEREKRRRDRRTRRVRGGNMLGKRNKRRRGDNGVDVVIKEIKKGRRVEKVIGRQMLKDFW
jgi:hypothetical protein